MAKKKVKCWKCKNIVTPLPLDASGATPMSFPRKIKMMGDRGEIVMRHSCVCRRSSRIELDADKRVIAPGARLIMQRRSKKRIGKCPICNANLVY